MKIIGSFVKKLKLHLTRKMQLSDDQSRHIRIKTFTKQNWVIQCYQSLLMKIFRLSEYHMFYKGAAGKAFSAYMPTLK
jgi:hypothetical protein